MSSMKQELRNRLAGVNEVIMGLADAGVYVQIGWQNMPHSKVPHVTVFDVKFWETPAETNGMTQ